MWSILTDAMPEYISAGDACWRVRTDFRIWLRVGQIFSDSEEVTSLEEQKALIEKLCGLILPEGEKIHGKIIFPEFIRAVSIFYAGPQPDDPAEPDRPEAARPASKKQYDFVFDAGLIYQSFASFYHVRLAEAEMHWWEFLTLFNGLMLNEGNSMNTVAGIRNRSVSNVPKQQQAAIMKAKKQFALPKSDRQKAAEEAAYDYLEKMWAEK